MKTGVVKFYLDKEKYGFITSDDGSGDIFVHCTRVKAAGLETLVVGRWSKA